MGTISKPIIRKATHVPANKGVDVLKRGTPPFHVLVQNAKFRQFISTAVALSMYMSTEEPHLSKHFNAVVPSNNKWPRGVKARTKQITNNCCWIWLYPKTMTTINPSKFNPRYDCFKLGEKSSLDADTFVEGTNHMTIRVSKKTSTGCRTWRSFSKTIWVKFYSRGRGGSHWTRVT